MYVQEGSELQSAEPEEPASLDLHPDRQAMLERPDATEKATGQSSNNVHGVKGHRQQTRRPERSSYAKEVQIAEESRHRADARHKLREERDKDRRAMSKARQPDRDGKYRLGRQSKVLLGRVKRIVAEG